MPRLSLCLLWALFSATFLHAQPPGEGWVLREGNLIVSDFNVQDFYTRERFVDDAVQISIYKEDSTTLLTKDVTYWGGSVNGKRIVDRALAQIPYQRRIVIVVEKEGYDPHVQAVDIPEESKLKKNKFGEYEWNGLGKILIHRSLVARQLGEAQVTASRLQMVVKGDTLEYNVANLQLSAGSMLDNLIRNLPGAQLDKNGRITINGEFVERLLVNGREFFNGDAMVALKNLPYYTVGKIKVYHNIGSNFSSKQDSLRALAQSRLTMDVRLKKIYSEMWLANFEVGEGFRMHGDHSNVYFGRFFTMRFTDHSSIGIYGIANNVGKNYSATHEGNWREMQAYSGGEPETQTGGLDFSVDGKKSKVKFNTTLKLSHETNQVEYKISTQNFYASGDAQRLSDIYTRLRSRKDTRNFSMDWNADLSKQISGFSISLSPRLTYRNGKETENGESAEFDADPMETQRSASLDSLWMENVPKRLSDVLARKSKGKGRSKNSWLNAAASAYAEVRMPNTRNRLSIRASTDYKRTTYENIGLQNVWNRASGTYYENSFSSTPNHDLDHKLKLSYPLFMVSNKKNFYLSGNLSYTYEHKYAYAERALYKNADEQPDYIPDMSTGYAWEYNLRNSYLTDQYADDNKVDWAFTMGLPGFRKDRTVDVTFNIPVHADVHRVKDIRNHQNQHLRKTFCYVSPYVRFMALNYQLHGSYELKPNLPLMNDMLDIRDDAYTSYRTEGNPHLKMQKTHEFQLSWNKRLKEKSQWVEVSWMHEIINHRQTMARTYDKETGVTTSRSENINGNWWTTGRTSYGRALDAAKHFNLSASAFYTYAHSVDYSSDNPSESLQRFTVYNHRAGGNASISYSKREFRVSLDGNVSWNGLTSPAESFQRMSYTDMYYTLSLTTPLLWHIDFDTDLKLNMRRGYHEASMNTTEWVWNAALSTKLGKNGQWVVRAVAFDILHNLSNVRNTIDAQGHTEWWQNGVQSYASFHLVYHIKVKPSKKGIE